MIEDADPVELNISPDKVRDIVLRARAFELEEFPDEPDPGSEPDDIQGREERLDDGEDQTEAELREMIDDLNEDETVDLIALAWVGRGDFGRVDWAEARALARERRTGDTARYLMGMPTLDDCLSEGLAELGYDPEALEED